MIGPRSRSFKRLEARTAPGLLTAKFLLLIPAPEDRRGFKDSWSPFDCVPDRPQAGWLVLRRAVGTLVPVGAAPPPEDEGAQVKHRPGPMASSGTEVHWVEPGLGKGAQRRRWAWAENGKDADGRGTCSSEDEGPFPTATSPELLEDFCRAQQCLQPLKWGPDSQPAGCQDPESGESAEAGEADSPTMPQWYPKHPTFWWEGGGK